VSLRVLGIDPGLRITGYGAIEVDEKRARLLEAGIVAPDVRSTLEQRLHALHRGMSEVVASTKPDMVVIEELFSAYKNPLTAVLMGHARGVLCLAAAQHGVPVHTMGHSLVKRALTGSGAAKKEQVRSMVIQLLGLARVPEPTDVSDALALALAYGNRVL
jgi:crossover junction endodeoxyribonuclease RuvC